MAAEAGNKEEEIMSKCGELEAKVEKLKDGLRVVLEEFYQLGGKLGKDEDGVFRVDYDDDMDGLTKLKDGLAIGCAFNHAILDGTSTWHFMSTWAQICRSSNSVAVPPFLDRTKARNTRVKLDLSLPPNPLATFNGDAHQLREKLCPFPKTAIDKIKPKANSHPPTPGSKPFSTFQSLAGKSGGRSIDVEITLEAAAVEQLEKDDDFLMEVL
ncbi:cytochrome P450 76C1-like [Hibiscus syriacus]|uniref:Cytochrome P450 76C1-like n=1 Tax=Hibiscus syriacus TaxID=106335 RepID=A0A6A2YS77_HIBSY|nr:cytochrome P450 76C1-like [Hibiscus syriacus]